MKKGRYGWVLNYYLLVLFCCRDGVDGQTITPHNTNWPSGRFGHCTITVPFVNPILAGLSAPSVVSNNTFIVFGGSTPTSAYVNDILVSAVVPYNGFFLLSPTNAPAARRFHACAVVGNVTMITGGQLSAGTDSQGVHISSDGGYTWITQPVPTWSPRELHKMVVLGTTFYVMGGRNITTMTSNNEVWSTSNNGTSWTQLIHTSPSIWSARNSFSATVYRNQIWLMAGKDDINNIYSDVWTSTDGAYWNKLQESGVGYPRFAASLSAIPDGGAKPLNGGLYLMAGTQVISGLVGPELNDWRASPDGTNWCIPSSTSTPLGGVRAWMASVTIGSTVYFSGGYEASLSQYYSQIYAISGTLACSTNYQWTRWAHATWAARSGFAMVAQANSVYVVGGTINGTYQGGMNDVWMTEDGNTWSRLSNAPFSPRSGLRAVATVISGGLMIFGGGQNVTGGYLNDFWTFDGSFWSLITLTVAPGGVAPPRAYFGFALDPGTDNIYIDSGIGPGNLEVTNVYVAFDGAWGNWQLATTNVAVAAGYFPIQSIGWTNAGAVFHYGGETTATPAGTYMTGYKRTYAQLTALTPATVWTPLAISQPQWSARSAYAIAALEGNSDLLLAAGQTGPNNATIDVWITTDGTGTAFSAVDPLPVSSVTVNPANGIYTGGFYNGMMIPFPNAVVPVEYFGLYAGGIFGPNQTASNVVYQYGANPCTKAPCLFGGTCNQQPAQGVVPTYLCTCAPGYSGLTCSTQINECSSLPCLNGGSCINGVNSWSCGCAPGYVGQVCQTEIDECASHPCLNGGTCADQVNGFLCTCLAGYSGAQCQTIIDECASQPCLNNGTCVDLINGFLCNCTAGYSGSQCQTNTNECASSPCKDGGTCVDGINSYTCICPPGYSGKFCGFTIDNCASTPCLSGATCNNSVNFFTCICLSGYSGTLCQTDINECASIPCQNGGTCIDGVNSFACNCPDGFFGVRCQALVDECASAPCLNGATCVDHTARFTCTCVPGYSGVQCQTDIDECASQPCLNGGTCVDSLDAFSCMCATGYSGSTCQAIVNYCTSTPCQNGATCNSYLNGFNCTCATNYTNTLCNQYNYCFSMPCGNNTSCFNTPTGPVCACGALNITCLNNGTCVNIPNTNQTTCLCTPGYSGLFCQTEINECASSPCQNGGSCQPLVNSYQCTCSYGYSGSQCQSLLNLCTSFPCLNGGSCVSGFLSYNCTCAPGYSGLFCQTDIDECTSQPCVNSGSCVDGINSYICTCPAGYSGSHCQTNINECASVPCHNNGTCIDHINSFNCTCQVGYTGSQCQTQINECSSSPCRNNGTCINGVNSFTCNCTGTGYIGTVCQTLINECTSQPCQNNATCTPLVNAFRCNCHYPWNGTLCNVPYSCVHNPCANGGTCYFNATNHNGYYGCTCPLYYTGKNCSLTNGCLSYPCQNGGTCQPTPHTEFQYQCTCPPTYTGFICQTQVTSSAIRTYPLFTISIFILIILLSAAISFV